MLIPALRADLRIGRRVSDSRGGTRVVVQDGVLRGLSHPGFAMSSRALAVLEAAAGDAAETAVDRVFAATGVRVQPDQMQILIANAEDRLLLETEEVAHRRAGLEAKLTGLVERPLSDLAAAMLPAGREALTQAIDRCFYSIGELRHAAGCTAGLLLPHGSLAASGQCAASGLRRVWSNPPDVYIIVGPNHVYPGAPSVELIRRPFATPLGTTEVAVGEVDRIEAALPPGSTGAGIAHYRDHSIEMVLVLLQWLHRYLAPRGKMDFTIVPILLTGQRHRPGDDEDGAHTRVWQLLAGALRASQSRNRAVLIASGDLTHWGQLFNHMPFPAKEDNDLRLWDQTMIDAAEAGDAHRWAAAWRRTNCCAGRPLYVALHAQQPNGAVWSTTDYKVHWSKGHAVSFASLECQEEV